MPPPRARRDEALEPAEVEVHVERRRDQAQVHVGGQGLLAGVVVGAREQRAARQDVADRLACAQRDPVARGGQVGRRAGGRLQRARGGHERVDRLTADRVARPRCTAVTRAGTSARSS